LFFVVLFLASGRLLVRFSPIVTGVDVSAGKSPFYPRRPTLCERSVTSEQFSRSGGAQECQEVLDPIPKQGTMLFSFAICAGDEITISGRPLFTSIFP
jgi:hypothetical protein